MKEIVIGSILTVVIGSISVGLAFAGQAYIEKEVSTQVAGAIKQQNISEAERKIEFYNTKEQFAPLTPDDKANRRSYEIYLQRNRSNK